MVEAKSDEYKYITVKVFGGEMPGPTLNTKVGPHGVMAKKVGETIIKETASFKGQRVHVELAIKDRQATVKVIPNTAALIIKALNEPVRDRKKQKNILHNGSIKLIDVINIARQKIEMTEAKTLTAMTKSVLGTCLSVGCLVDGKSPKEITKLINEGTIKIPEK